MIIYRGHGLLVGIIAEAKGAKPNLVHIDIEIIRRSFGEGENQVRIGSAAVPKLHIELHFHQTLKQ